MAYPSFWRDVITVIRPTYRVERGSRVPNFSAATEHDVTRCHIQPGGTGEENVARSGRQIAWVIEMPATADIQRRDVIRIKSSAQIRARPDLAETRYRVVGEPLRWPSASGRMDHVQIRVEAWKG